MSLGNEVRLSLPLSLCPEVSLSGSPGADVGLGPGLSGSESVLENFSLVDDLGGYPDTGGRPNFDGGVDFSLRHMLYLCHMNGFCLVLGDSGRYDLGVDLSIKINGRP